MNRTNTITALDGMPASITIPELQKEFEAVWSGLHDLQKKSYLLMGRVNAEFALKRAREIDGNSVTFMFQKRGIEVTVWLTDTVWVDADQLLQKADALYDRIEALS